MKSGLKIFFEPKSIAIIGASDHEEKVGGILLKKAVKSSARVFPISLNHDELLGLKAYKSVLEIKEKIDLAVIAIPAQFVPKALEECGKKGVKNVILISAGFSEVGNLQGEKEILEISRKYGIIFIGANCFGICNPSVELDLTFSNLMANDGDVAFISQSGALWSYAADLSGFGVSKFVSIGNAEGVGFDEFIEYFSKDEKIKKIYLYIEKLKDGKKFVEVCQKAVSRGKKIYAVKGGSSGSGEKAAVSHTASLASDYAIYRGAFRQAGVVQCESFSEMLGLKIKKKNISVGKSAFILTNAGGAGVLLSDYLSGEGVEIVDKSLDILGTALAEDYWRNFNEIKSKDFETLFVIVTPQSMTDIENIAQKIVEMRDELRNQNKNVIAVFLGEKSMSGANKIFEKNGVEFVNRIEEL